MAERPKQILMIEWLDHASQDQKFTTRDSMAGLCRCSSVGYIVEETEERLTICQGFHDDMVETQLIGVFHIAKGAITQRWKIEN